MSDNNAKQMNFNQKYILAIYGPMIYTALYVMLLMRANPLLGQVGEGWLWKSRLFWAPNGTARCHFTGPKKVSI